MAKRLDLKSGECQFESDYPYMVITTEDLEQVKKQPEQGKKIKTQPGV